MVNVPDLAPATVGLKLTLMVQLALTTTLEPQVLVSEKLLLTLMLVMLSAAPPVLVSMTL
jgi:hypothetical protein